MGDEPLQSTGALRRGVLALAAVAALVPLLGVVSAAAASPTLARAQATTVWLCRPGGVSDPCESSQAATSVSADGATSPALPVTDSRARRFDCFYVYPTSSTEPQDNADLTVQPRERAVARVQVSRFSQVCNVWAPMYRQATIAALKSGAAVRPAVIATAYDSLLSAWRDYLAHDNHGRPIVFIGHSQGAAMLIRLLRAQVDPSPALRKRMVSAIILGGNVQVPTGHDVDGGFRNIPTCASASQTRCVIAYSSFGSPPPANALFGRAGRGVSLQSGQTATDGQQVACVNPVTFSASAGILQPFFSTPLSVVPHVVVGTPWVTFPGLYTAQCEQASGASWLQVDTTPAPGDVRPTVNAALGPAWGYHQQDVNLALGNLVADVAQEEAAFH
jgi:Protein of unknown function (DUF3089)